MNSAPPLGMVARNKQEAMEIGIRLGCVREAYEHSILGWFDVTAMREGLRDGSIPYERMSVDLANIIPYIRESVVTCPERVDGLPRESWAHDPGIVVCCEDETHLIIDGVHRALRRDREGMSNMHFDFVLWKHIIRPIQRDGLYTVPWGDKVIDEKGEVVSRKEDDFRG